MKKSERLALEAAATKKEKAGVDSAKTEPVKKTEKAVVQQNVEAEKTGGLGSVMVRISAENPEYTKMRTEEGWFQGVGHPRLPELNKDIKLLLSMSVKNKCALFGTAGGIRVLKGANGKGGVMFIERKNMQTGKEVFLFAPADKPKCEEVGLVVTRESKGVYVSPRDTKGNLIFPVVLEKFSNNHSPMGFATHPWEGYTVEAVEKKVKKIKKDKAEKSAAAEGSSEKKDKKVVKMKPKEKEAAVEAPPKVVKKKDKEGPSAAAG